MTIARRAGGVAVLAAALALAAACGESKKPKVDAAAEQKQALERAKQGPFATQVNSLEAAKALEADVNQKAQDRVDSIEKDAK